MGKTRSAYPPEFRRQMVELVHAGRSPEELAREFEPTAQSIRNWVAQAGRGLMNCSIRRTDDRSAQQRTFDGGRENGSSRPRSVVARLPRRCRKRTFVGMPHWRERAHLSRSPFSKRQLKTAIRPPARLYPN
jgi:transposase-like protein